jgi:BlaI family transcriptional regulator, penicillinase repressor
LPPVSRHSLFSRDNHSATTAPVDCILPGAIFLTVSQFPDKPVVIHFPDLLKVVNHRNKLRIFSYLILTYEFFRITFVKKINSMALKNKPTESELEILKFLWENGPSTVKDVNDSLSGNKQVGYTTTLKLMQIMTEKGLVERDKQGRTHLYEAAFKQDAAQQQLLDKLLYTAFSGSATKLVMQALGNHTATNEELELIRTYIDELKKQTDERNSTIG